MAMPERSFDSPKYRYGFNGKEKDESGEWGSLTHYDYGFRIYNPGIARFLSVDPLYSQYSELTPYQFASNTPIAAIDLDGLEACSAEVCSDDGKVVQLYYGTDAQLYQQAFVNVVSGLGNPNFELSSQSNLRDLEQRIGIFLTTPIAPGSITKRHNEEREIVDAEIRENVFAALFSDDVDLQRRAIKTINLKSKFFYNFKIASLADILVPSKATFTAFKALVAKAPLRLTTLDGAAKGIGILRKGFNISKKKNIAFTFGELNGTKILKIGHSGEKSKAGTALAPVKRFFSTKIVGFDRAFDSEVKILEEIAQKFSGNTQVRGKLTLVTERAACGSCQDVISQFQKMFPNIDLKIVNGTK